MKMKGNLSESDQRKSLMVRQAVWEDIMIFKIRNNLPSVEKALEAIVDSAKQVKSHSFRWYAFTLQQHPFSYNFSISQ